MRRLVAKYRFVKSDMWSLYSTNKMARESFTMAQATGTTWLCVLSSKLVCVHGLCHALPTFRFCALHNVASTWGIGMDFTLKHGCLLYTMVAIHLRVSGFAVCTIWPPDAKSESKSPLQPMLQGHETLKSGLK